MSGYKEVLLAQRPETSRDIGSHLFEIRKNEEISAQQGQIAVQVTHLSLDPAMLGWMMPDETSYIPPVALNSRMRGLGIGTVIDSKNEAFQEGDTVMGMFGWTELAISDGQGVTKLSSDINREMALSIFALPGLTATQGFFNVGKPKQGETIVVTGAAGSVGSIVGQLAKAEGLRVIGVVGSEEKANWIVDQLGFDGAVNYKSDTAAKRLEELTPDGVDIFFENTGGALQQHVIDQMNAHGRVVVCGMIADYQSETPRPGPNWIPVIKKRLTIQGFTMPDHFDQTEQLLEKLTPYVLGGKIQYRAHVLKGLENAVSGLSLLFTGENRGKLMVEL
ncbi:NADP-dependent oxidoreductase [Vibrio albus]|uniref:NADP-dependent oxidoreductase n=1 Tax=Vibrio albus TaxID=2200953 RepID=A0A2U3B8V9_9VIBR|nr:NADP-dependent oxidoreductase [Vibrio albus]PWI33207.1 NADP-dependent oxidoreductase [Vibrio albus]